VEDRLRRSIENIFAQITLYVVTPSLAKSVGHIRRKSIINGHRMEKDAYPLLSIITPTYNRADDYLVETLESVLAQDYPNIEYIVLDDGSTDNTRSILETYSDRIIWESHPNMGVIRTVNKGFTLATGEFITVVNSDDPLLPNYASQAAQFMQDHPHVLAAYPDWLKIDQNSNVIERVQTFEYDYLDMLGRYYCFPGPGTILRRRALELEPEYDDHYPHIFDYEYYLRLGLHGALARIPETLAQYRDHAETITSQGDTALIKERFTAMTNFFSRDDLPQEVRQVKRRAFSNANFVAGLKYRPENRAKARVYFLKALLWYPFLTARNGFEPRPARKLMLTTILPDWVGNILRWIKSLLNVHRSA
jgi:glycosyltransferase involved in cell wall biosynthesis